MDIVDPFLLLCLTPTMQQGNFARLSLDRLQQLLDEEKEMLGSCGPRKGVVLVLRLGEPSKSRTERKNTICWGSNPEKTPFQTLLEFGTKL